MNVTHSPGSGPLVRRHTIVTRVTHWIWAVCLFFLLLTGLQIFNAHPVLYWGDQSGFAFDNSVLRPGPFPGWATIPSNVDLATGRVIHFFFAWIFVATLLVWAMGSLLSGHLVRDLVMRKRDWAALVSDARDHARLRFRHGVRYGPLQRLSYGVVLFVLFPLMGLTGLAMSPGANAAVPWLPEILGGRQSARTLHFVIAAGLLGFFFVHVAMVLLAGPLNEMRAILTGWYRADSEEADDV
ncbi:cytochrome b/b6 domain-containing protein [uncultured Tateyamaria sp.]|uniref:cytochrome b/b6 domain-containing protein n=1 Tax=uncultured Tateyamaria sp. TaxID=455651 RepID=UPI002608D179|nr:cytochrome b/b6 domain-containing protein [uncultured Tateyamaria sp.]